MLAGCQTGVPTGPGWVDASVALPRSVGPTPGGDVLLLENPFWKEPDAAYGSKSNPARVGGISGRNPGSTHRYFHRLRGPEGQRVHYRRLGSCCEHPSPNGLFGDGALLDHYLVTYEGLDEPVDVYVSFYDPSELAAPPGFTLR